MKPTKLQELSREIAERKAYLKKIEEDIAAISDAGNNQLVVIHAEINEAERIKADLLRQNLEIEQRIRENKRLAEIG